jgi:DNA-binding CsgD family transcriptional regulator
MKNRLAKALALICYVLVLCFLFGLDWALLFQPMPFFSVVLGMILLTACQYRKRMPKEEVLTALRWNLVLAAFLTTLISFFASADTRLNDIGSLRLIEKLLPLLYGSILYMLLGIFAGAGVGGAAGRREPDTLDLTATETAESVFRSFSMTKRECHVAQKLLQELSNKEIAAELYISEATVKKHIQNIYQKIGASDRAGFRDIYFDCARNGWNTSRHG